MESVLSEMENLFRTMFELLFIVILVLLIARAIIYRKIKLENIANNKKLNADVTEKLVKTAKEILSELSADDKSFILNMEYKSTYEEEITEDEIERLTEIINENDLE